MRNFLIRPALVTLVALLAACGGSGTPGFVSSGSSAPADSGVTALQVGSSQSTLPPDGSVTATITVIATNSSNVAVSGASVNLATSAGTLSNVTTTTGTDGTVTATLSANGVAAGTNITVTATSGSIKGTTTVAVAATKQALSLLTSTPQIASSASSAGSSATITGLLVDANNNAVSGATVTFSPSSGTLASSGTDATTSASGTATATLTAGTDPMNRVITINGSAGTATATPITVNVVGTTLAITSGPTSLVQGAQGTYTVVLTDSSGTGISGKAVQLSSKLGNTLPATVTTGANGQVTFQLTANVSGSDEISAMVPGTAPYVPVTATPLPVTVSSQVIAFTTPAAGATQTYNYNTDTPVTVKWTNGGNPVSGGKVNFSSTRGTITTTMPATTAADGTATVTINSSTAGQAIITATAVDGNGNTVTSTQVTVNFVVPVANAKSVSVQANPASVALQGQSTVVATVTDGANANGNPVQGATVDFTLTDSTGGTLSAGSAVTNAQGQATVTYTAGGVSSAANGVVILATLEAKPSLTGNATLTVGGQTVFLSLGTGNQISALSTTQYEMPFTVQAVSAAGNGLSGVTVTFTLQSVAYAEGFMAGSPYAPTYTAGDSLSPTALCKPTYVTEVNGTITGASSASSGGTLIPGLVASTDVASATTNATGTASVNIIYPKSDAYWVAVALTATASVQGSQNSTTSTFWLPVLASDLTGTGTPPNLNSPFGAQSTCW